MSLGVCFYLHNLSVICFVIFTSGSKEKALPFFPSSACVSHDHNRLFASLDLKINSQSTNNDNNVRIVVDTNQSAYIFCLLHMPLQTSPSSSYRPSRLHFFLVPLPNWRPAARSHLNFSVNASFRFYPRKQELEQLVTIASSYRCHCLLL